MGKYEDYSPRKLYKNSRRGKICGIFSGLGEYMGINPLILRVIGIGALFITGPIVIVVYLLISLLLDDKPYNYYR